MLDKNEIIHCEEIEKWKKAVDIRAGIALKRNLEELRNGKGAALYGAHCTAVFGMPQDEVTADDIKVANASVRKLTNYLDDAKEKDTSGGRGEIDFVAIRIVRLLFINQERIEPETAQAMRSFFLKVDFLSRHHSENHMFMSRASRYLAACYYKDEYFEQYNMSAAELKELDKKYLIDFLQYRARRGWAEFNSLCYEIHNFNTLLALSDCAEDTEIKTISEMTMEVMLLTMMENSTKNGIYGGAHARSYDMVIKKLQRGTYTLDALYFGGGDFENTTKEIGMFSEPFILISKWRPSNLLYTIYANKKYPILAKERTHNHTLAWEPRDYGYINKYTYSTQLYSIGCVNYQDAFPESDGWYEEHQQTNWSLTFAENPNASITTHHPGSNGLHSYWFGDWDCCCNHLFGQKNKIIGVYYIPYQSDDLINYIHAYVAKGEFDKIIEKPDENKLYLALGDVYVALMFSHEYAWGGQEPESEIVIYDNYKTSDIRIAFACEVSSKNESGSFEEFIEAVENKAFIFDADNLDVVYDDMHYTVVPNEKNKKRVNAELQHINGELLSYPYPNTYSSSIMISEFDSGVFRIYGEDTTRIMDFISINVRDIKEDK